MCLERVLRNLGFAIASAAIVAGLGFILEFEPVLSSLAR